MKLNAKWTDDCQGKKDYDGDILSISTRYWPAGGGFSVLFPDGRFVENPLDTKPSATSSLILSHGEEDYIELAKKEFEGETFEDVKTKVEEWAQEQMDRIVSLLLPEQQNS